MKRLIGSFYTLLYEKIGLVLKGETMLKATIQVGAQLFFWAVLTAAGVYGTKMAFDVAEDKILRKER